MVVNEVRALPVERLRHNPANPKRPLGLKYKRGLRASLDRFGFAGLLVVAANSDGTYEVLDGNTRLEELERAGVESVPCVVYQGMDAAERKAFVLAHDRHRKVFDEDAVLAQLQQLAEDGGDTKSLALLAGKDNLDRLLAEAQGGGSQALATPAAPLPAMASLVLYGPAAEVKEINALLKQVKGRLTNLEKARKALGQAVEFLDWSDERLLAVLLAAVARFGEETP